METDADRHRNQQRRRNVPGGEAVDDQPAYPFDEMRDRIDVGDHLVGALHGLAREERAGEEQGDEQQREAALHRLRRSGLQCHRRSEATDRHTGQSRRRARSR